MVVLNPREGSSIFIPSKVLHIGWSLSRVTVFHSSVLDDMVNWAKLFKLNGGALPGGLDTKEARDISALNFQVHLSFILHLVN